MPSLIFQTLFILFYFVIVINGPNHWTLSLSILCLWGFRRHRITLSERGSFWLSLFLSFSNSLSLSLSLSPKKRRTLALYYVLLVLETNSSTFTVSAAKSLIFLSNFSLSLSFESLMFHKCTILLSLMPVCSLGFLIF